MDPAVVQVLAEGVTYKNETVALLRAAAAELNAADPGRYVIEHHPDQVTETGANVPPGCERVRIRGRWLTSEQPDVGPLLERLIRLRLEEAHDSTPESA